MTTAIIPFDRSRLATALKSVPEKANVSSALFLKMTKQGEWVHGIEGEEIPEGQQFMVNPQGFQHGYICWLDTDKFKPKVVPAEKLGEVIGAIDAELSDPGPVPKDGKGWEFQLGMHLIGKGGDLDGKTFVFRSTSVGGKKVIASLASLVGARLASGADDIVPVVTLGNTDYKHKTWGKIFNPTADVVGYVEMPTPGAAPKAQKKLAPAKKQAEKK